MSTHSPKRSLTTHLIIRLTIGMMVVFAALIFLMQHTLSEETRHLVHEDISAILKVQMPTIRTALDSQDHLTLAETLERIMYDRFILSIRLVDIHAKPPMVLATAGADFSTELANARNRQPLHTFNVRTDDPTAEPTYRFEYLINEQRIEATVYRELQILVITCIVALLIIIAITRRTLQRAIRPITILTDKLAGQEKGAQNTIICIDESNIHEINSLFEAFRITQQHAQDHQHLLVAQKDEAIRANEAKSAFLSNMSHELRTPLNSMISLSNIIIARHSIPADEYKMVQTIHRSSTSLLSIVNDILDISKIESDKLELEKQPFNLKSMLNELESRFQPLATQQNIDLLFTIQAFGDNWVDGDELRTSRILTNLIGNAIKFTEVGGVTIRVQISPQRDKIFFACDVIDSGIGIPEDKIEHIFNKFTQAEESTERRFGGTGLGLNITKGLIQAMEGAISVSSTVGKGSTFSICIPFAPAKTIPDTNAQALAAGGTAAIDFSSLHLLIAEDHELNVYVMEELMSRMDVTNYQIVGNGKLALEAYQRDNSYHLILMDCHMPVMNGYDASTAIRQYEQEQGQGQHIPIIATTADAMVGTRELCLKAGMDEYLTKPIDEQKLRAAIAQYANLSPAPAGAIETGATPAIAPPAIDPSDINPLDELLREDNDDAPPAVIDLSIISGYTGGNPERMQELIGIFLEKSQRDIQGLRDNQTDGENTAWSEAAHAFKGASGFMGAEALRQLCATAQDMHHCSKQERETILAEIEARYQETLDALHAEQEKMAS